MLIPENITITVGLDAATRALLERLLDLDDAVNQKAIDALAKRLNDSRNALAAGLAANPDPNPID